jgi:hypothetical protein
MAIACLRLFTVPPFPPFPDFSVPFFLRRIADSTRLLAAFPYLRLPDDFYRAANVTLRYYEMLNAAQAARVLAIARQ